MFDVKLSNIPQFESIGAVSYNEYGDMTRLSIRRTDDSENLLCDELEDGVQTFKVGHYVYVITHDLEEHINSTIGPSVIDPVTNHDVFIDYENYIKVRCIDINTDKPHVIIGRILSKHGTKEEWFDIKHPVLVEAYTKMNLPISMLDNYSNLKVKCIRQMTEDNIMYDISCYIMVTTDANDIVVYTPVYTLYYEIENLGDDNTLHTTIFEKSITPVENNIGTWFVTTRHIEDGLETVNKRVLLSLDNVGQALDFEIYNEGLLESFNITTYPTRHITDKSPKVLTFYRHNGGVLHCIYRNGTLTSAIDIKTNTGDGQLHVTDYIYTGFNTRTCFIDFTDNKTWCEVIGRNHKLGTNYKFAKGIERATTKPPEEWIASAANAVMSKYDTIETFNTYYNNRTRTIDDHNMSMSIVSDNQQVAISDYKMYDVKRDENNRVTNMWCCDLGRYVKGVSHSINNDGSYTVKTIKNIKRSVK